MIRRTAAPAVLLAAGLALTGCSDNGDDAGKDDATPTKDPTAAAVAVAKEYQEAANRLDWRRACELSTKALRRGTVDQCAARNVGPETATPSAPASESPTATFSPPTYADGSTPEPIESMSASGPERAETGAVAVQGDPVKVPASEDHPAGYGVLVTYTVTWPDDTSTDRRALRLVAEGDTWRVDQHEDVQDGDMGHGDPVTAALSEG
ncbi:hypothetical protein KBZ94_39020 [Streptomyces sp. RM72]|uniref:hypothetical protein n=1 Tax=Streptomyces sp. RM72 TaxID=1115510 RepID=UPI001B366E05|nr:hypothetical protein [Streptomyces sp. RM72]MBQ0890846.1 hypothetical protein [Streptomyces sp. RM72]